MRTQIGAAILLLCAAGTAGAQAFGSLIGTVHDPSGGIVSGAAIAALSGQTGIAYSQTSNSDGDYAFSHLPGGTYTVTFSAASFSKLRVKGIEVHVATVLRQDATLELASFRAQVKVVSSTPLVETDTAEIGQLVDARQITQLPLNGRNVYSLLTLTAGSETGVKPGARFTTPERPALAGGRAGYTVFRLDGIDINSQNLPSASVVPGVDAVREFRAITQLAPASQSSISSVNLALRSGTNAFHGTAYDFFRNNVLDAHPFFERNIVAPGFQTTADQLRYNQFGGSLGGPIEKDHAFFFLNLQFTRSHTVSQVSMLEPTAAMLAGDFSGVNPLSGAAFRNFAPVADPATLQPFPGNRIPDSRVSAFAGKFISVGGFLPANCLACQAGGLGFNYVGEAPSHVRDNQFLGRIDDRIGRRDSIFGDFQVEPSLQTFVASPNPVSALVAPTHAYFAALNETHAFGPDALNEIRLGYTRLEAGFQQQQSANGAFTFQNTPTSLSSLYPTLDFVGYPQMFGNGEISDRNFSAEDSWDFSDNFSYTYGAHNFEAGFELIRAHFWDTVNLNAFFIYADGLPGVLGFTGNSFADFLTGVPFEGVTFQGTGRAQMVERSVYAGYVQDQWRVSRRLTLNAGLRYEFPQRWRDSNSQLNRLGTLDTGPASQAMGGRFLLAGSPDYYLPGTGVVKGTGAPLIRDSIIDPSWRDFQPRVGLAYRPFNSNKTAIRGGFGIYYALPDANSVAQEMTSPPFSFEAVVLNLPPSVPLGRPLQDSQFFPSQTPSGVADEGDDPRNRDPRLYEWAFSIERQVSNHLLFAAEYLGNYGIDNPLSILIDTPPLPDAQELAVLKVNPALNSTLALERSPFSNAGLNYQYVKNIAPSWYDALNLKAEGRFGKRLNFSAVYTWSKALDWESAEQEPPGTVSGLAIAKSYADYDHPQRFVASWVYDLPGPRSHWKWLLSGWESTGIATFEAGPPYSIEMGVDTSFRGGSVPVLPNMTGPPVTLDIRRSGGIYLTPQNFTAPPFGTLGTLARNAFHGPGLSNFDLGILKNIPITERVHAQFRGELFNAFNHAQFAFGGSSLASSIATPAAVQYFDPSQFGRASARAPRIVQLALKLIW
ncbi:MAG: TonB-dependent receptor domain-containing protein [Bryobacteraceae bacterium]